MVPGCSMWPANCTKFLCWNRRMVALIEFSKILFPQGGKSSCNTEAKIAISEIYQKQISKQEGEKTSSIYKKKFSENVI